MIPNNHSMTTNTTLCRKILFAVISLSIIILMIYSNSFDCSWHLDDTHSITDNPNIHLETLSWKNIYNAMHSDQKHPQKIYRPVSCLSFAFNYYFGELNESYYHLVNISVHLIASIFLFQFIYRLFDLPILKDRFNKDSSYFIALLTTVLWAVNPIQVQAVTYIVQRMASMAGMFYIMSMYFYLLARTSQKSLENITFFLLSISAFALSLGSKENAAMLPFSLIILEIFLLEGKPFQKVKENPKKSIIIFSSILLAVILYIILNNINLYEKYFAGYNNRPFTLTQRIMTEPRVIIFYISLILYPVSTRLNIAHDIDVSTSLVTPITTSISILIIIALIGLAVYNRKKYPLLAFSICFFFLNHIIESSFLNLELIFEHRNYIPSMFFFLPISAGLNKGLHYYKAKKSMQYIITIFIVLFLVGLGHLTFIRNVIWKNEKTLWIDAVEKSPDLARPHHNLGKYYHDYGRKDEAFSEYMKAMSCKWTNRNSESFTTFFNLGELLADNKEYEKAENFYRKALSIKPESPAVYNNLATLYEKKGDIEQSNNYLIKSFNLYPYSPITNLNLGLYYLKRKEPEKALYHLNMSNAPNLINNTLLYMGIAYKQMGRHGRAVMYFKELITNNPNNIMAYMHISEIYLIKNNKHMAKEQMDKAVSIILKDNSMFKKTMNDLIKDNRKNINPSLPTIIPLIKESIEGKTNELALWKDYIKEIKEDM